ITGNGIGVNGLTNATIFTVGGTPTGTGTETFQVTGTDSVGASSPTTTYSVTVSASALTLVTTPAAIPTGTPNLSYGPLSIAASGGSGTYTYSFVNNIIFNPVGLNIAGNGTGQNGLAGATAIIVSGTPVTMGTASFTVKVNDGSTSFQQAYTVSV